MKLWIAAAAALLAAGCLLAGGCGKEAPEAGSSSEGHVHIVTHANWNPFEYLKDGKITGKRWATLFMLFQSMGDGALHFALKRVVTNRTSPETAKAIHDVVELVFGVPA